MKDIYYMYEKSTFSITQIDPLLIDLVKKTDHKILGIWANDCAVRVLLYFTEKYSQDNRPVQALSTLKQWVETGEFHMSIIRGASLGSHAAARAADEKSPARSAARAAGQAVATAHVSTHSLGAATYAAQAIYFATHSMEAVAKEQQWQYKHLVSLREIKKSIFQVLH
jgi:hypothetical protein